MGSFVGLHIQDCSDRDVLKVVSDWLKPFGFGDAEPFQAAPDSLKETRLRSANAVGCERLNDAWHIVLFNSFSLGGTYVNEVTVGPLAASLPARVVLVVAQTTSDVCQLALFDKGQLVRLIAHADGQLLEDHGPRLPGEPLHSQTGPTLDGSDDQPSPLDVASDVCRSLGFDLWRSPPLRGPGHIWRKRSLLARLLRA